jgi:acyl dehydratase
MSIATVELHEGLELPARGAIVDAERQRRYHTAAELAEGLFGETVDLSILANDCILAGYPLRDGRTTNLHMSQRMVQSAPVRLGEPLRLTGRVAELAGMGKGRRVRIDLEFTRADGSVPVRAEMTSGRVDRAAMRQKGAGSAKTFGTEGFEAVAEKHPTAARVTAYSAEFPLDQVHFDPAVAAAIGLPAPVAQGLMSLTWMMEVLAKKGVPAELDILAEFRRPIFWDDRISVLARDAAAFQVWNADDQVCSIGRVARLVRD